LLEETAVSYSNVQGARERRAVAEQSVQRHQELQQQIQRRAAGGLASTVDVSMAQTRLLQAALNANPPKPICATPKQHCWP
jgi:adhesin transport system outer membrane protein